MKSAKFIVFGLVLLVLAGKGWGQLPVVTFEVITSKEGLPSNTVLSAMRDHSGFMWFGTRFCPVRYNGSTFQSFMALETNFVTGLATDHHNNVWLSSDRAGICKIEAHTLKMTNLPQTMKNGQTGDLYIDAQGAGWYSDRLGINRLDFNTGKLVHYPFRPSAYVWIKGSFVEDHDKTLWVIGSDNGLFRYDRARDTLVCVLGADSDDPQRNKPMLMSQGCVDSEGFLWIATYNYGLIKYNTRSGVYEIFATGRISNQVTAVAEGYDENGRRILWVGDREGLGIFRPDQHKFYFFSDMMSRPFEVNSIFCDKKDGIVWVCTDKGIIKYHPKSNLSRTLHLPKGLVSSAVAANVFLQDTRDKTGNTWYIGLSHTGMLQWNRVTNEYILIRYPGASAETRWMVQREDGTIWIGTNRWDYVRPGIFVYDPQKGKFITTPLADAANRFFSVPFFMYGMFDQQQRLWVGNSDEGFHVLDEKQSKGATEITPWTAAKQKGLIRYTNLINDMKIDRKGQVWLGTFNGLYRADEKTQQFINVDSLGLSSPIPDFAINSLLEDRHGNILAARWGGLTQLDADGKQSILLTTRDGFFDRENHGLAEDHMGNIWIGNYEGLYCYYRKDKRLIRFTVNDGLMSNHTVDRIFASRDGRELFIGQENGFNLVLTEQLLKPSDAPVLAVSSFSIHEKAVPMDFSKRIQLSPSEDAFSVDFIALNYRKEHDNQYAYYLEGFEEDWNYSGTNHKAYYTNLGPGEYTLHIKAADTFANWSTKTLDLQLKVLPAFYETWWFKALVGIFIAGLLFAFYRYRINQILHLQQVRNRISADLHDELGSSLSGISIMGALAQKEMAAQHPSLALIERMVEEVRQISGSLDDIVWNIKPKNDALASMIARMTRYASELFEAQQISYEFKMPEHPEDLKLTMEQRRNFYLIFKESVNNLVKYSRCTHASVQLQVMRKNIVLMVSDNGVGFTPDERSERNGLQNLHARAKVLKGKLAVESVIGKGTTVRLELNLK